MTLDDVKRVFHATPPEFAPYLEHIYHLQGGTFLKENLVDSSFEPRTVKHLNAMSLHRAKPESL